MRQLIAAAIGNARGCDGIKEAQVAGDAYGRRIAPEIAQYDAAAWRQAVGRYPVGHPIRAYLEHAQAAVRKAGA